MARNDWLSEDEKYQQAVRQVQQSMDQYNQANGAYRTDTNIGLPAGMFYASTGTATPTSGSSTAATAARRNGPVSADDNYMVDFQPVAGVSPTGKVVTGGTVTGGNNPTPETKNAPANNDNSNSGGGGGSGSGASAPSYSYNPNYASGTSGSSGYYDPLQDPNYAAALQALQLAQGNKPVYANSYEGQLADLYNQIVNRDPFKYDLNGDMLYQQYKNQYIDLGNLAMRDTMGQAAGLTGGYGSTYAQNAGQQAYNSYLQRLNDIAPELYDRAYNAWLNEGNQLEQNYALLSDRADDEYQKYLNDYNQWAADRDYALDAEQLAYNRGKDQWATQYAADQDRAQVLASYGDFSGYANIYGGDAANALQRNWIYDNPALALRNGLITQDEYNALVPQVYSGGGGYIIDDDNDGKKPEDDNPDGVATVNPETRVAGIEQTLDSMYANGSNGRRAMTLAALNDAFKDPESGMDRDTYIRLMEKYSK